MYLVCEIAGQLADAGNKVKLLARSGRHFCLEKTKQRLEQLEHKMVGQEKAILELNKYCFAGKPLKPFIISAFSWLALMIDS